MVRFSDTMPWASHPMERRGRRSLRRGNGDQNVRVIILLEQGELAVGIEVLDHVGAAVGVIMLDALAAVIFEVGLGVGFAVVEEFGLVGEVSVGVIVAAPDLPVFVIVPGLVAVEELAVFVAVQPVRLPRSS